MACNMSNLLCHTLKLTWLTCIASIYLTNSHKQHSINDLQCPSPSLCIFCLFQLPMLLFYIIDIGECVTDGVDHCAGGGECRWKDGKYQCVCATNGVEYCTGKGAECRNINDMWTCVCDSGYYRIEGLACTGLFLKNIYNK